MVVTRLRYRYKVKSKTKVLLQIGGLDEINHFGRKDSRGKKKVPH